MHKWKQRRNWKHAPQWKKDQSLRPEQVRKRRASYRHGTPVVVETAAEMRPGTKLGSSGDGQVAGEFTIEIATRNEALARVAETPLL